MNGQPGEQRSECNNNVLHLITLNFFGAPVSEPGLILTNLVLIIRHPICLLIIMQISDLVCGGQKK